MSLKRTKQFGKFILKLFTIFLGFIVLSFSVISLLIFLDDFQWPGGIFFDSSVSLQEKFKIREDLNPIYLDYFRKGMIMKVSKYTFPNCDKSPKECSYFTVDFTYNKYGDTVPAHLELENGVYKLYPSL